MSFVPTPPNLTPASDQRYGFPEGASSPMQAGLVNQLNMNATQTKLAKMGGKRQRHTKRGGDGGTGIGMPKTVVVPQFASSGPPVSPNDANASSVGGNIARIGGLNDATNDGYARHPPQLGGKRKSRKSRHTKKHKRKSRHTKKHRNTKKHNRSRKSLRKRN
uniref:Uncharacterized protein n=1 Tax=viral metagenome TaxID=1070528 RepID=A0A6C0HH50_9ZZZZ